jgi:serpin B
MNQTEDVPYARGSGWAAVEMPYRDSTMSLMVVLPTGSTLPALERRLDPAMLDQIAADARATRVSLSIPRIHLTLHTNLEAPLRALGVTTAFTDAADFSRIVHVPLKIGVVEHAADLRIDEAGTVAAAATGVSGVEILISRPRPSPVPFDADRPFLFFLRDDRTGAVLFAGRLLDAATAQN